MSDTNVNPVVPPAPPAVPVEEKAVPVAPAIPPDSTLNTGRRKSAVARVRVKPGTGQVLVNGRDYKEFFPAIQYQEKVVAPLKAVGVESRFDVSASVKGGGLQGQAGAVCLGIARGLKVLDPTFEHALRENGLLTRDARMKERKKYGLHGARRGVQFSKR